LRRVRSNPQGDSCRLDGEFLLVIPDGESIRAQEKAYLSCFARSDGHALKLRQGPDRFGNTGSLEADVALHRFHTRAGSGVVISALAVRTALCLGWRACRSSFKLLALI